jgi:hypothetical protein
MAIKARWMWTGAVALGLLATITFICARQKDTPMLFHYGTPEVPREFAFAIMNPFRNRLPETIAERLISDLHTSQCEKILRDLHSDGDRICPAMQAGEDFHMVWREDEQTTRILVYDLPKSKSRLQITSSREEAGFAVRAVSLIR